MTLSFLSGWFYGEVFVAIVLFRLANAYLPVHVRHLVLVAISLFFVFQMQGSDTYVPFAIAYAFVFPVISQCIFRTENRTVKRWLVALGIAFAGLVMLEFKYPYYASLIFGGRGTFGELHLVSWLGLSYMTFRAIDLILHASARRTKNLDFLQGVTYLLFFTPFIAGPINRYAPFAKVQEERLPALTFADVRDTVLRVSIGIIKIVVFGQFFYYHSVLGSGVSPEELPPLELVLSLYAYLFYIYMDFSGYCDVAIALGKLFGVPIPENFRFPYLAKNLQDFWNRWHISLSHWCRDYIFYSLLLFLSKKAQWVPSIAASTFSIFVTFFFVGAWHGDSFHWLLYGFYHGLGLSIFMLFNKSMTSFAPALYERMERNLACRLLSIFLTFNFFALGLLITLGVDKLNLVLTSIFGF